MKMKPILFSTPMVQAILEGRKTQTRRNIKYNISWESSHLPNGSLEGFAVYDKKGAQYWLDGEYQPASLADGFCPYGKPGDILWVRESWNRTDCACYENCVCPAYIYRADQDWSEEFKWKPSIHMPKDACRLFLRITDIRVERLQDITEEDAMSEGTEPMHHRCGGFGYYEAGGEIMECTCLSWDQGEYCMGFKLLWQSINGPDSWERNDWVWVVNFERIDKPE